MVVTSHLDDQTGLYSSKKEWSFQPEVAGIYLTRRCNLNCSYCSVSRNTRGRELDCLEWIQAMRVLDAIGIRKAVLLGGEPTLVSGLDDIIRFVRNETRIDLAVVSNCMAEMELLESLSNAGLERFSLSIDQITGGVADGGSLEKSGRAMAVLDDLTDLGFSRITAYHVVSRLNLDELPDVIDSLSQKGIWSYLIPYHFGLGEDFWETRDREKDPRMAFGPEDHKLLVRFSEQLIQAKRAGKLIANSSRYLEDVPQYMVDLNWHCSPITAELRIDSDGSLMCCHDYRGAHSSRFSVFDIYKRSAFLSFQLYRALDASRCRGCIWPSQYHALETMEHDRLNLVSLHDQGLAS